MIRETTGDILTADCEALVNPVNTVGVMGKGLAAQFKAKYPDMCREYSAECALGGFDVGYVMTHKVPGRYIISFPTKRHWRDPSRLEWIDQGLAALRNAVQKCGFRSVAIPSLGCGLGGLRWADVRPLIVERLGDLADVDVVLYVPRSEP